jgi:hypothetical protein
MRRLQIIAVVDDADVLYFDIATSERIGKRVMHHPDFFAGRFLNLAFAYFKYSMVNIDAIQTEWPVWSDNYETYMREFLRHGNRKAAVRETWSARQLSRFEYTRLQGVYPVPSRGTPERVFAIFYK